MSLGLLPLYAQQSGLAQAMAQAAAKGSAAPVRNAFDAPGSREAIRAAAESLHALVWVIPFILIAYILLAYVIIKFRDKGDGRKPATFHENNPLELLWTVIPAIVVVTVALHSYPTLTFMEFGGSNPAVTVDVVGHQFFWEYKYPQYGIDISNQTLVVPANQVVDLDLTSVDVIHGFYVPGLGIQMDALPGRLTNLWFKAKPGYYKGQCTQLCGADHAQMFISVQAVPEDQFQAWLAKHASQSAALPAAQPAAPSAAPPAALPADQTAANPTASQARGKA